MCSKFINSSRMRAQIKYQRVLEAIGEDFYDWMRNLQTISIDGIEWRKVIMDREILRALAVTVG